MKGDISPFAELYIKKFGCPLQASKPTRQTASAGARVPRDSRGPPRAEPGAEKAAPRRAPARDAAREAVSQEPLRSDSAQRGEPVLQLAEGLKIVLNGNFRRKGSCRCTSENRRTHFPSLKEMKAVSVGRCFARVSHSQVPWDRDGEIARLRGQRPPKPKLLGNRKVQSLDWASEEANGPKAVGRARDKGLPGFWGAPKVFFLGGGRTFRSPVRIGMRVGPFWCALRIWTLVPSCTHVHVFF